MGAGIRERSICGKETRHIQEIEVGDEDVDVCPQCYLKIEMDKAKIEREKAQKEYFEAKKREL